jgi:hypothetical protein
VRGLLNNVGLLTIRVPIPDRVTPALNCPCAVEVNARFIEPLLMRMLTVVVNVGSTVSVNEAPVMDTVANAPAHDAECTKEPDRNSIFPPADTVIFVFSAKLPPFVSIKLPDADTWHDADFDSMNDAPITIGVE